MRVRPLLRPTTRLHRAHVTAVVFAGPSERESDRPTAFGSKSRGVRFNVTAARVLPSVTRGGTDNNSIITTCFYNSN